MSRSLTVLVLLLLSGAGSAQEITLDSQPTRWRFTGELIESDDEDDLGLAGLHYDVLELFSGFPEFYAGVGGFAAASGERGGLFVGGVTLGFLREIGRGWFFDAGYFAGGGGGGGGSQNDGLMLRPHVGIEKAFDLYGLRVEWSDVRFPDGDIDDSHVSVGLSLLSESLSAREHRRTREIPEQAVNKNRLRVTPSFMVFDPSSSTRRTGGRHDEQLELIGIGLDYALTPVIYLPLEAYGASNGEADGFAMATTGIGLSIPLLRDRLHMEAEALLGAGGGGDIDTGGGWLWNVKGGLRARLWRRIDLELTAGRMKAPDGELEGNTFTAGLSLNLDVAALHPAYPRESLRREGVSEDLVEILHSHFELLAKTYRPEGTSKKTDGSDYDSGLDLIGIGFDYPLAEWLYVTGAAYGAFHGNIGGYAEGLFGLRYEMRPLRDKRHAFTAGAQIGAAGGGGMDVGSGLIYTYSAGYRYELSSRASLVAEFGSMDADQGSFQGEMYLLGLSWDLALPRLR